MATIVFEDQWLTFVRDSLGRASCKYSGPSIDSLIEEPGAGGRGQPAAPLMADKLEVVFQA